MATQYKAPVEDYVFLLHDALGEETAAMSGRLDRDDTQQILEQSARFFEERWAPLDAAGDAQDCRFSQGEVTTPEGYKAAYDAMRQGGWNSVSAPAEYGGGGLPGLLGQAVREFAASSCGASRNPTADRYGAIGRRPQRRKQRCAAGEPRKSNKSAVSAAGSSRQIAAAS